MNACRLDRLGLILFMAATPLLAPWHGHAQNPADALDQTAVEQPATNLFRKHWKKACVGVLIWLSGNLPEIYQGAWMSRPKNEPILVTEYEVPPDTSSFAVAARRSVYAINDKGNVVTGTGAILPDFQETLAIGAFRNHVLKLDRKNTEQSKPGPIQS